MLNLFDDIIFGLNKKSFWINYGFNDIKKKSHDLQLYNLLFHQHIKNVI